MKEESLLLLSDLQKLINQVVLIDYTIIILGSDYMKNLATDILRAEKKKARIWQIATIVVVVVAIAEFLIIMN